MAPRKRPLVEGMRNVSVFLSQPKSEVIASKDTTPISKIIPPARQPRHYFDPAKLAQLTSSIEEHGILEPLLVRPLANGDYELVAGERRLRAAQELGLSEVPIIIKALSDREALQVSLLENLQREDLTPIEETEAILELLTISMDLGKDEIISLLNRANHAKNRNQLLEDNVILQLKQVETILTNVGRFTPESFRVNRLPLLNLSADVLEILRQGKIEYTKARAIARVGNHMQRKVLLEEAIANDLSLSQIKKRIVTLSTASILEREPLPSLKQQFDNTYYRIKKAKIWDDPKKKKKLERLLTELNALVPEELG
jgi:ParB family transcriptional regulator, chromosome partitioning protein